MNDAQVLEHFKKSNGFDDNKIAEMIATIEKDTGLPTARAEKLLVANIKLREQLIKKPMKIYDDPIPF